MARTHTLLNVQEVADRLRVSKMTVYRMIHTGALPALQIGRSFRVPRKALDEYCRQSIVTPEGSTPE